MYGCFLKKKKKKASEGWKWRFCQPHGIRQLSLQGEKLSADTEAADTFIPSFRMLMREMNLSLNQVFNCDETGLNFWLLPLLQALKSQLLEEKKPRSVSPLMYVLMFQAL